MKNAFIVLLGMAVFSGVSADERTYYSVKAVETRTPMINGLFGDAEWQYGGLATDFLPSESQEGVAASQKAEAYFLYDDENLYVGIKCLDDEPGHVMSELAGRRFIPDSAHPTRFCR